VVLRSALAVTILSALNYSVFVDAAALMLGVWPATPPSSRPERGHNMEMDLSELACRTNPFGFDVPRDFLRLGFNCVGELCSCTQTLTAAVDSAYRERDLLGSNDQSF